VEVLRYGLAGAKGVTMALTSEDRSGEERIQIDASFVRQQANTAVRQFFRPITAPFQFAAQTFATQQQAIETAKEVAKRSRR
jgi:hypothetical protein